MFSPDSFWPVPQVADLAARWSAALGLDPHSFAAFDAPPPMHHGEEPPCCLLAPAAEASAFVAEFGELPSPLASCRVPLAASLADATPLSEAAACALTALKELKSGAGGAEPLIARPKGLRTSAFQPPPARGAAWRFGPGSPHPPAASTLPAWSLSPEVPGQAPSAGEVSVTCGCLVGSLSLVNPLMVVVHGGPLDGLQLSPLDFERASGVLSRKWRNTILLTSTGAPVGSLLEQPHLRHLSCRGAAPARPAAPPKPLRACFSGTGASDEEGEAGGIRGQRRRTPSTRFLDDAAEPPAQRLRVDEAGLAVVVTPGQGVTTAENRLPTRLRWHDPARWLRTTPHLSHILQSPGVILAPQTAASGVMLRLGSATPGRWLTALSNRGVASGCWRVQLQATVLSPGSVLCGGWVGDCVNLGDGRALNGMEVTGEGGALDLILFSPPSTACALPSDVRALQTAQAAAARAAFSPHNAEGSDDSASASGAPGEVWAESATAPPVCAFARRTGGEWTLLARLEAGRLHLFASLRCESGAPSIATVALRGCAQPTAAELIALGGLVGQGPIPAPRPLAELPWR